jgi:hypothetical protein
MKLIAVVRRNRSGDRDDGAVCGCFHDERNQDLIEHEVVTLVGQQVFGIALGYEDPDPEKDGFARWRCVDLKHSKSCVPAVE